MSTIKGNNEIDDLFRQASDRYPLRTDSADWDRMVADLDSDPSLILPPVTGEGGQRRRRWVFWLWLLLPLAGIGYYAGHQYYTGHRLTGGKETTGIAGNNAMRQIGAETASSGKIGETEAPDAVKSAGQSTGKPVQAGNETEKKGKSEPEGVNLSSGSEGNGTGETATVRSGRTGGTVASDAVRTGGTSKENEPGAEEREPYAYSVTRVQTKGPIATNVRVSARADNPVTKAAEAPKKAAKQKTPHFYAGILVAPDLSLVKFQPVKGVGNSFGLLVGYSFNRKWAIETGASLDTKKYYSEGRYYKKEGYVPPTDTLTDVNGVCHMIEVPINLRYNLGQGPMMKWFVTAGLSNYFMSKQSYAYGYQSNGSVWTDDYTYKKPAQYWFSIVNLSLGYEQKLGKAGELRIEPYVRLPLSGIGLGSLPIMSTGVNIGFTHRFR